MRFEFYIIDDACGAMDLSHNVSMSPKDEWKRQFLALINKETFFSRLYALRYKAVPNSSKSLNGETISLLTAIKTKHLLMHGFRCERFKQVDIEAREDLRDRTVNGRGEENFHALIIP